MGLAAAALIVGHWFAYAFSSPHGEAHHQMLEDTGHSYLGVASQLAAAAGIVCLLWLILWRSSGRGPRASWAKDAMTLVVTQASLFVAMEFGERLVSGAPLDELVEGPLLAYGLLAQAILALLGAALLWFTERSADAVRATGSEPSVSPPLPLSLIVTGATRFGYRRSSAVVLGSRAPPIPG